MNLFDIIPIVILLLVLVLVVALLLIRRRRRAADADTSTPVTTKKKKTKAQAAASKDKPAKPAKPAKSAKEDGKHRPKRKKKKQAQDTGHQIKEASEESKILGSPAAIPAGNSGLPHAPSGKKIRILLVDDNTGTRENVSRLLYFEDDLEVIGQAVNGRLGVEMAIDLKPHIVLMDINMPDMDGITATKEMAIKAPYSQVIIMSVQADHHYMKQAMAAGARDFQPKPFTSEELVSCIRRVYGIGQPMYQQFDNMDEAKKQQASAAPQDSRPAESIDTPVIVVFSPKGGVGTSAVAANMAVALQQEFGDVVLLDGSFQFGDISVHLNTRPTRTVADAIHDGMLEEDLITDVVLAHNSGLKVLLAPAQPELAEAINGQIISDLLQGLRKEFSAVVVDTATQLNTQTLSLIDNADFIVLLSTPELTAVKSVKLFMELLEELDYDLTQLKMVLNRNNIPGGVQIRQIEKVLKMEGQVFIVPDDNKMHIYLNRGTPICLADPNAPSAVAIKKLAHEVWELLQTGEPLAKEAA